MIVLGIAPGVRNLAYCVLSYKDEEFPEAVVCKACDRRVKVPRNGLDPLTPSAKLTCECGETVHVQRYLPWVPRFGADLLKGIRMNGATVLGDLQRKATAHVRVLDVIFQRFPPVVIGVGPPARPNEPELHTEAARFVLRLAVAALAEQNMRIQQFDDWRTKDDLLDELHVKQWSKVLRGRIENLDAKRQLGKPGVQIAAATALAASARYMRNHKSI